MEIYNWPFRGNFDITCKFGKKGTAWAAGFHVGVDFVGRTNKEVYPIAAGKVIKYYNSFGGYGKHIMVQDYYGRVHVYAHLSECYVKSGDRVDIDKPIGVEGSTGNANGSHLHLEIHEGAYKYPPAGSTAKSCTWLVDAESFIKKKLEEAKKMAEKQQEVSTWAKDAWEWTRKNGIIDGTRPKDNVTREEMAVMLMRIYQKIGKSYENSNKE